LELQAEQALERSQETYPSARAQEREKAETNRAT